MRIISGKFKATRIKPPKNFKARPTTDFAKENLFNVLSNDFNFDDLSILDLFGGTGSISYEFASRGVQKIDCVELDYNHFKFIRTNFIELELEDAYVHKKDAFRFIKQTENKYDIIFADPPYTLRKITEIPNAVFESGCLQEKGWLIVEHPSSVSYKEHARFKEHRNYGGVNFSIFY